MPWVVRDAVDEINRAVGRHWQGLDRISGMTRDGVTAYLQTMFVRPSERGRGAGAALVGHAHAVLDARGVDTMLLHYAQLNPLSAPFWNRMGYRPLWTGWEARPAVSLR
jgi:GNAT superfamily N-acetyltransferase